MPSPEWHDAVCVEHKDGTLGIYQDQQSAVKNAGHNLSETVRFQKIRWFWNADHAVVDFGHFVARINATGKVSI